MDGKIINGLHQKFDTIQRRMDAQRKIEKYFKHVTKNEIQV